MRTLNLGILAHVDAGKTTLTERLLYAAGVIDEIGSVDDGSTQTDTLALERQRGITIKSAVVSFVINNVTINLIDTPGHPDFIAEVERVLNVLDGAVIVISAVEGVQAQTRVLMRTLQRLRIPTLIFVNKIDRRGAQDDPVLRSIAEKLTPAIIAMGSVRDLGARAAAFTRHDATDPQFTARLTELLADQNDVLLAAYVDDETNVSGRDLLAELAAQTLRAVAHPVFFGSAITGAGVEPLMAGITELLPAEEGDVEAGVSATAFKIERGPAGEKISYVRVFSGTLRLRDRVQIRGDQHKITAISVFERGAAAPLPSIAAGQIGKLWGLAGARIGDTIGAPRLGSHEQQFAPPTLETVIVPRRPEQKGALHAALTQLVEQDPLINLRQDDVRQELFVSLYGEIQKEVIQATLHSDFGIDVDFRETTVICIERPVGTGAAVETMRKGAPFLATVGLRIDPAPIGSGVTFTLDVEPGSVPLYVYKSTDEFQQSMEATVRETLRQGIHGWEVTDCAVTMTDSGYSAPGTTSGDFRKLTPLVVMSALKQADTAVCEPIERFHLEIPSDTLAATLRELAQLPAVPQLPSMRGSSCIVEGEIPAARVHALQQQLRAVTRGEGVLECAFSRYEPVHGTIPNRPRSDHNVRGRKEYLLHVVRRVSSRRRTGG